MCGKVSLLQCAKCTRGFFCVTASDLFFFFIRIEEKFDKANVLFFSALQQLWCLLVHPR